MPHKILLVEDNADLREMMEIYLASEGFSVIAAGDGNEAIEIAVKENPELIVTDARMPMLDGIEMTKQLRTQWGFRNTPIIILTGMESGSSREAKTAGADEVFAKPISPAFLVTEIDKLLRAKSPRQSSTQESETT
jgi:two-component system alkaline phosphatase synthesis response regulator PhoP